MRGRTIIGASDKVTGASTDFEWKRRDLRVRPESQVVNAIVSAKAVSSPAPTSAPCRLWNETSWLTLLPMRFTLLLGLVLATSLHAAERVFDFGNTPEGKIPSGFAPVLSGEGKPGDWKVVLDDVPPLIAPLSSNNPVTTKRPVLAQLSQDKTDERFPILLFDLDRFANFKFTTRIKMVSGQAEQMAGIVFRYQNASNYTVLRVSSLGNTLRFYKVANGERLGMITSPISAPTNVWHDLSVQCEGNQILCSFAGKEYPPITDNGQALGKVGFWTKSDAVSYFSDAKVTYKPLEMPAQTLVRDTMARNSRLIGLKVAVAGHEANTTRIVGSSDPSEVGRPGTDTEGKVLKDGQTYYGKAKKSVVVTMPLRDRNGDVIAAARVIMTTFRGQTEKNAVERAAPIVRELQAKIQTMEDLAF